MRAPSVITTLVAAALLALFLWSLFRFAMGLRYAKLSREEARRAFAAQGREVVAELPQPSGDVVLFLEDAEAFYWAASEARKGDVLGAQLLLNGRAIDALARPGARLEAGPPEDDEEGRERWDVVLHLAGREPETVACGHLREGISREAATRVFEAVKRAVEG